MGRPNKTQDDAIGTENMSRYSSVPHGAGFATTSEAAGFLHLSKAMIHKMIGVGAVPVCRYGRAVRIPWTWLRAQAGE